MTEKTEDIDSEEVNPDDTDSEYEDYKDGDFKIESKDKSEKTKSKKWEIMGKCFNNVKPLAELAKIEEIPVNELKKNLKRHKVYHNEARKVSEEIVKEVGKEHFDPETLVSIKKILAAKKRSYSEIYGSMYKMIKYGGPYVKKRYGPFQKKLMRDRDRAEHATMIVNQF